MKTHLKLKTHKVMTGSFIPAESPGEGERQGLGCLDPLELYGDLKGPIFLVQILVHFKSL